MKHFIYAIAARKRPGTGYSDQHLKLWKIVKGVPQFCGNYRFHHEDPRQAATNAICIYGGVPKKLSEAHPLRGGRDYAAWAEYCTITDVSHTKVEWR